VFSAFNWQLSYLPGYTEFTALYDQYKIESISLRIIPTATTSTPNDPATGYVTLAVDYDDAVTPTSMTSLFEYGTCQVFQPTEVIEMKLHPRIAKAAYSGAFTSYASEPAGWIDVGSPSVQHYGLKVGLAQTTVVLKYNVFAEYELSFKSSR